MQSNNYPSPDFLYKYSYISDIREWDIIQGWKNIRMGDRVMDSDGNAILIIDPGSLNTYDGPDFKQAILYMNGQIHHGDIECHKTPSGWYHHGHENDPNYQNVILHVVGPFRRKNRQPNIPHVVLTIPAYSKIQCTISKQPNTILEILLPLATYRWQKKLAQYDRDMSEGRMVETSCGIFGTKGNEQGFLQIWNVLKDECHKDTSTDLLQKKIDTMYQSMEVRWSRAGIRPNARHKKRIPLFVSFIYLVSRMSYHG